MKLIDHLKPFTELEPPSDEEIIANTIYVTNRYYKYQVLDLLDEITDLDFTQDGSKTITHKGCNYDFQILKSEKDDRYWMSFHCLKNEEVKAINPELKKRIPAIITDAIKNIPYPLSNLADDSGVPERMISGIADGTRTIQFKHWKKLARALFLDIDTGERISVKLLMHPRRFEFYLATGEIWEDIANFDMGSKNPTTIYKHYDIHKRSTAVGTPIFVLDDDGKTLKLNPDGVMNNIIASKYFQIEGESFYQFVLMNNKGKPYLEYSNLNDIKPDIADFLKLFVNALGMNWDKEATTEFGENWLVKILMEKLKDEPKLKSILERIVEILKDND